MGPLQQVLSKTLFAQMLCACTQIPRHNCLHSSLAKPHALPGLHFTLGALCLGWGQGWGHQAVVGREPCGSETSPLNQHAATKRQALQSCSGSIESPVSAGWMPAGAAGPTGSQQEGQVQRTQAGRRATWPLGRREWAPRRGATAPGQPAASCTWLTGWVGAKRPGTQSRPSSRGFPLRTGHSHQAPNPITVLLWRILHTLTHI